MLQNRILVCVLLGLLVVASGCSSRKPIKALVTLDGKAVEGATVVLLKDGGTPVNGFTTADGTATLDSSSKEGVPPGDYKVVVTKMKPMGNASMDPSAMKKMQSTKGSAPKSELPAIYADAKTTPLTLKIPPASDPAKIELKSKP